MTAVPIARAYARPTARLQEEAEKQYRTGTPEYLIASRLNLPKSQIMAWRDACQWKREVGHGPMLVQRQRVERSRLVGLPLKHPELPRCKRTDEHSESECGLYRHEDLDEEERRRIQ